MHIVCSYPVITDKIKELNALKEKTAALEAAVAAERAKTLASLPRQYGFDDVESFIEAVLEASGGRQRGRRAGRPAGNDTGKRRRRAIITDETRAEVKKLAQAGKTGAEIAKAVGISVPSVQNVKKALGLVEKRK